MLDSIPPYVWQYVSTFFIALCAVLLFLLLWGRRESRRAEAQELLIKVAPWGIEPINRLLGAYVIGNYVGADSIGRVLREVYADLKGDGLVQVLRRLGWKIVKGAFLTNVEDQTTLRKLLDAANASPATEIEAPPET